MFNNESFISIFKIPLSFSRTSYPHYILALSKVVSQPVLDPPETSFLSWVCNSVILFRHVHSLVRTVTTYSLSGLVNPLVFESYSVIALPWRFSITPETETLLLSVRSVLSTSHNDMNIDWGRLRSMTVHSLVTLLLIGLQVPRDGIYSLHRHPSNEEERVEVNGIVILVLLQITRPKYHSQFTLTYSYGWFHGPCTLYEVY